MVMPLITNDRRILGKMPRQTLAEAYENLILISIAGSGNGYFIFCRY